MGGTSISTPVTSSVLGVGAVSDGAVASPTHSQAVVSGVYDVN